MGCPKSSDEIENYDLVSKRGEKHSMPLMEVFITIVRLRKSAYDKMLADLYEVTQSTISRIVNTWILFFADRLSLLPIWPSKQQVNLSTPSKLKHFNNLHIIIDCTEMFLVKPQLAIAQKRNVLFLQAS